jgi:hypothetical protein
MAVINIKVPKTPRSAFNKNRPASDLLKAQLEHLEAAAGKYLTESSASRRAGKSLSEGQAAVRIHELTRALHPSATGEQPAAGPAAVANPTGEPLAAARRSIGRLKAAAKTTLRKGGRKARKKG